MTNFLSAGIIKENISDIYQKTLELKNEQDIVRLKEGLQEIEDKALDLAVFMEKLSCEPLIYTGPGSTQEVINRLDWALTFSEEIDPIDFINHNQKKGKKTYHRK
jgi:hypothetical protein